jgi:hypothetical protein
MRDRQLFSAVWAVIALGTPAAMAGAQAVAPLVIHKAQIQAAGWGRVSDLVQGAAGWQSSDVESFDATASPDGLPPAGESAPGAPVWLVLVDGQPVPVNLFGAHQMDLLPVSIAQVDSVVVLSGPVLLNGASSSRGAIEIFTRAAPRGFSGEFTYEHGDETGDPGPFRYTPRASPNLEKIGPFGHAEVGFGTALWDLALGLHGASLNTTDSALFSRRQGRGPSAMDALTPTARLRIRALGGEQEVLASRGGQRGELFIPNSQFEQSLRSVDTYVGASGSIAASSRTSGGYTLASTTQRVKELPSALPFTVGHERRLVRGDASVTRHGAGPLDLTVGVAASQWRLVRADTTQSATSGRAYLRAALNSMASRTASLSLSLVHAPYIVASSTTGTASTTALDGQLDLRQTLRPTTALRLSLARVHALSGASDAWIDRILSDIPQQPRSPVVSRGSLALEQRAFGLAFTLGASVSRASDWLLQDDGGIVPESQDTLIVLPNTAASRHDVTLAGFGARVQTPDAGRVRGYLEYDHSTPVAGDAAVRTAQESAPSDALRGQVAYVPFTDVQLGAGLALTSATTWSRFAGPDGEPAVVPPLRRVNASAEKWFWHRRLHAAYVLENILNKPDRDHPFGAQWNLRFHAIVGAQFGFDAH